MRIRIRIPNTGYSVFSILRINHRPVLESSTGIPVVPEAADGCCEAASFKRNKLFRNPPPLCVPVFSIWQRFLYFEIIRRLFRLRLIHGQLRIVFYDSNLT
jgi:hypothetical protein